ncbi:MAG: hypothetical protein HY062_06885 [Bacteroidetes bacterium]|nr:hypothetical protein [Bacteroidota bacterium]
MNELNKKREKRYNTDIGKDSDDLVKKLQVVFGNKKMTKKEVIYRSLEHSHKNKLNLKESPEKPISRKDINKLENSILEKIAFHTKSVQVMIDLLKKHLAS